VRLAVNVGSLDLISGGAINQGVLFALGRLPQLAGRCRVIEFDLLEASNLNRYPLATSADVGSPKAQLTTRAASDEFIITPTAARLDAATAATLAPFADRILVGVDRISIRWEAQRQAPDWVWVGGTSHLEGFIWTHPAGEACAGCANPTNHDDDNPDPIPTISFVSGLTGTLLAYEFLAATDGDQPPHQRALAIAPFNLSGGQPVHRDALRANAQCPVRCPASLALGDVEHDA
jgi:molybdopterin/thiamine biosynthesis adenylyltransferase